MTARRTETAQPGEGCSSLERTHAQRARGSIPMQPNAASVARSGRHLCSGLGLEVASEVLLGRRGSCAFVAHIVHAAPCSSALDGFACVHHIITATRGIMWRAALAHARRARAVSMGQPRPFPPRRHSRAFNCDSNSLPRGGGFSGGWRALSKGTAWASLPCNCSIHHHLRQGRNFGVLGLSALSQENWQAFRAPARKYFWNFERPARRAAAIERHFKRVSRFGGKNLAVFNGACSIFFSR